MSDIIEQIRNLEVLKENLKAESCNANKPFISLGDSPAPTLDYDLPQSTTFSTYGTICVVADSNVFIEKEGNVPQNENYFNASDEEVSRRFNASVQLNNDDLGLRFNPHQVRKELDLSKTNLSGISLEKISGGEKVESSEPKLTVLDTCFNDIQLKNLKALKYRPVMVGKLNGFGSKIKLIPDPQVMHPRLFVIEEYKTSSYLGNYGAGKTLETFSLLPGEKTTITIKTYKSSTSTKNQAENLLDSFSQSSVDEMENLMEEECSASSEIKTSVSASVSASASFMAAKCSASVRADHSSSRSSNTRSLNRALGKHCEQSNSARNVEINTTSTETVTEGEEYTTVREIENINKSRVLNFVFRQLLQEYVSITYLSNIRIAYCNGYMESIKIVDIEEIDKLLQEVVVPEEIANVKQKILQRYNVIRDYTGMGVQFLKHITLDKKTYGYDEDYYVCDPDGIDYTVVKGHAPVHIPGVILNVQRNTLRTDSVIADALLGQGEALDCFNQRAQDAIAVSENLKNLELVQKISLIEGLDDPQMKAELYKSVFGKCCCNSTETTTIE